MSTRDAAVDAARRGYWVFPCRRDGDVDRDGRPAAKRPLVRDWQRWATNDPEQVDRAWPGPRNNIGIACEQSEIVGVDLDPPDGHEQLLRVGNGRELPLTRTVQTARGGEHWHFAAIPGRVIRNSASKVAPNVDIRGAGGYLIGPGSVVDGITYRVTRDLPVARLPEWLADLADLRERARQETVTSRVTVTRLAGRGYGARALDDEMAILQAQRRPGRNDQLNRSGFAMFQLVAAGVLDDETVTARLWLAAEHIGLVADDGPASVGATIDSARRGALAKPRSRVIA